MWCVVSGTNYLNANIYIRIKLKYSPITYEELQRTNHENV